MSKTVAKERQLNFMETVVAMALPSVEERRKRENMTTTFRFLNQFDMFILINVLKYLRLDKLKLTARK